MFVWSGVVEPKSGNVGADSERELPFMTMEGCSHSALFKWDPPPRSYTLFMLLVLICDSPVTFGRSVAIDSTCIDTLGEWLFCSLRAISKLGVFWDARASFCLSSGSNLLAPGK